MAKTKISEYDSTAANNTDIDSINIAEGCAPSGINNAIRELMAHLKDMNIGSTITMLNTTEEDGEGGRANKIIFKGEQSGGEESVLGEIQASHDGTSDDQKGDLIFRTNDGSDGTSPTQVAKLDSAGNLLVGANESGIGSSASDTGVVLRGGIGYAEVTRDGGTVGRFNRLTSDGTIVDFAKDGTQVGTVDSLAASGIAIANPQSNSYIALLAHNQSNGIFYEDGSSKRFTPYSSRDNDIDLGFSTGRWKDLYLSGGAYIGGTGAANYLDDYEEGTWTPVLQFGGAGSSSSTGVSYTAQVGRYTKVGKKVTIEGGVAITSRGSSTGDFNIGGLPFTQEDTGPFSDAVVAFGFVNATTLPSQQLLGLIARGTTQIFPREVVNGSMTTIAHGDLTNNSSFIFFSTYFTAS